MKEEQNKEVRQQAKHLLADEVATMLMRSDAQTLHWQGTRADLMEALYLTYPSCRLIDDQGLYMTFSSIVQQACRKLNYRIPRNPREVAARAMRRKGFKARPFLDRYAMLVNRNPSCKPFEDQIQME